jgi:hypothetical protein
MYPGVARNPTFWKSRVSEDVSIVILYSLWSFYGRGFTNRLVIQF